MPEGFRLEYDDVVAFQQALRRANAESKAAVKAVNKSVAELVVEKAKGAAEGRQAVKAAASLRAANTVGAAQVKGGSARLPWFKGAEFGSKRYKQFKPWRGNQSVNAFEGGAGYFLYPSIRASKNEILSKFRDSALDAIRPAFN